MTDTVIDGTVNEPAAGFPVTVSVDSGSIASVTSAGTVVPQPTGTMVAAGVTGADGTVTTVVQVGGKAIDVTGSIQEPCGNCVTATSQVVVQNVVGFAYYLCVNNAYPDNCAHYIEAYLQEEAAVYSDLTYQEIPSLDSTAAANYDVIFLAMPTRALYSSEISALSSFVQSSRCKRLVLVGEWTDSSGDGYGFYDENLDSVGAALGLAAVFGSTGPVCDDTINTLTHCSVNTSHYLMAGVAGIWDALTTPFSNWLGNSRPLAYITDLYVSPSDLGPPQIIEEDTATEGSIVAMHDSSFFISQFNHSADPVPRYNFKFAHNLCTIYPP